MKTKLLIILGIVLTVVISGAVYATNFENADADDINKGIGTTEIWEPGPTDGGPVYIPEKLYDANENSKYATMEKPSVRYDVTKDQLKENFELIRNANLGTTTLGIDYDRNMLVIYSPDTTLDRKIQSVIGDFPYVLIYEEEHPLRSSNPDHPELDSEKYYEEFGSGSPLIYKDTLKPVLDYDNCNRYAYWLTEHQIDRVTVPEDYSIRYPPWGNQIFPLVDYCIANGDLVKTIVDDKIQWEFQVENEN